MPVTPALKLQGLFCANFAGHGPFCPYAGPNLTSPFLCQLRWAWHVLPVTLTLMSQGPFCANFAEHGTFCGLRCGRPRTLTSQGRFCANFAGHGTFCALCCGCPRTLITRPFLCQLRWAWHVLPVTPRTLTHKAFFVPTSLGMARFARSCGRPRTLISQGPFCANFAGHGTFCGLRDPDLARPFLCQLRWAWPVLPVMLWPPRTLIAQGPFCANFAGHGPFCRLRRGQSHPISKPLLCQLRWAWHVLPVMPWPPAHPKVAPPFLCQLR